MIDKKAIEEEIGSDFKIEKEGNQTYIFTYQKKKFTFQKPSVYSALDMAEAKLSQQARQFFHNHLLEDDIFIKDKYKDDNDLAISLFYICRLLSGLISVGK